MAEQTKKSRMAIVEETTAGTPVAPSAGSDYIAIQEGFEVSPEFETLENTELTGSLGPAKTLLGLENPSASISHYIRHSGVEATAPGYGLLLEAAFGATSESVAEFDTVGGSTAGDATTRATIVVDAGEGASYERGEPLLIKDGTNGYNIRPVFSIATDTLSLGFNLAVAPAATINLGRSVLYKPGESHPTISVWDFRANGGAVQLIAGSRVTELSMEVTAGELINGSFSMEGIEFFYNPIEITATDTTIDFLDDASTEQALVTAQIYKDPHELADALATSMNAQTASNTITVTYSDTTGKYTIASDGTTLSLLWSTGAGTANTIGDQIGFVVASDDTGSLTYTSDNAITLTSPQTPAFDSADPLVAKANEVLLGDFDDITCFSTQSLTFTLSDEKTDENDVCATSGRTGSEITGREATVEMVANLPQFDADKFRRLRENDDTTMQFTFGTKSGGNWEAGKSGMLYLPTATISSLSLSDEGGLVTMELTLTAYVDSSGNGEVYLGFV